MHHNKCVNTLQNFFSFLFQLSTNSVNILTAYIESWVLSLLSSTQLSIFRNTYSVQLCLNLDVFMEIQIYFYLVCAWSLGTEFVSVTSTFAIFFNSWGLIPCKHKDIGICSTLDISMTNIPLLYMLNKFFHRLLWNAHHWDVCT